MVLLIPLAIWLSTAICYLAFYKNATQPLRRSILASSVGVFAFIAGITEVLGALDLVTRFIVTGSWVFFDVLLVLVFLKLQKQYDTSISEIVKSWVSNARDFLRDTGRLTILLIFILFSFTLLVAIVAMPNNLDSLSYHLSRLGYWVQNRNVAHYASHIERSISFSPLSEYVHLHTYLLSGTERYFQLLQWLCLVGILAVVSLFMELFNASRRSKQIALIFAATLPIALLESMTTQNDLVVAFFIVATAFFVFDYIRYNDHRSLAIISLTVTLGLMTKGTFTFYAMPFGACLFIYMVSKKELLKPLFLLAIGTIFILLLLNAPFWYRTHQIFGSPIGHISSGNKTNFNGPADFISSVSKHVFLHLGFISPGNKYNIFVENQLFGLHKALGIEVNRIGNGMHFKMNKLNFNEDFAHNFLAAWLIIFGLPLLCFTRITRSAKRYTALTFLGFLTFCFFIAYQTYGSRLHIAFFMLCAPMIGLAYGSVLSKFFSKTLVLTLWLSGLPFALLSVTHPLLSTKWFFETVFPPINSALNLNININGIQNLKQKSVLFSTSGEMVWGDDWPAAKALIQTANGRRARKIGFDFEEYSPDYAYQFSLRQPGRTFGHVAVRNPSKTLEKPEFLPDLIVSEHYEGQIFSYHTKKYVARPFSTNKWLYIPVN